MVASKSSKVWKVSHTWGIKKTGPIRDAFLQFGSECVVCPSACFLYGRETSSVLVGKEL